MPEVPPEQALPVLPMRTVCRVTGLTARQVRYYEARGLISPARSKGNQRLFSRSDVDRLCRIRDLVAQGFGLDAVRVLLGRGFQEPGAPSSSHPERGVR